MGVFKGKSKNTWREWRDAPWCTMMYLCTFGDGDAEGGSPCSCTRTSKAVQADLTAHLGHQRRRTRPARRRWDEWAKGPVLGPFGGENLPGTGDAEQKCANSAGETCDPTWAQWDRRLKRPISKHQLFWGRCEQSVWGPVALTGSGNPISKAVRIFLHWLSWFWF